MTSVVFCKKLRFSVRFRFYKINCGLGFPGRFFCTVCCLMRMHSTECFPVYCFITVLFVTYLCAELVQLTISRSDSELEVQRYGMKKNTLAVDPIMLEEEL